MYIFGHVPPGIYERHYSRQALHWFQDRFNRKYLSLVQSYSDVIAGQFFGHAHTDSFRVIYDDNGLYLSTIIPSFRSIRHHVFFLLKENTTISLCLILGSARFLFLASFLLLPQWPSPFCPCQFHVRASWGTGLAGHTHTNWLISLERVNGPPCSRPAQPTDGRGPIDRSHIRVQTLQLPQ